MAEIPAVLTRFFSAWSERNPALVISEVTGDVHITDPLNSIVGSDALVEHIETVLRRFEFLPAQIQRVVVEGDLDGTSTLAFVVRCPMLGRSSRFVGLETAFEAAVFATLDGGRIATWQEYWDPAPLQRAIVSALGG